MCIPRKTSAPIPEPSEIPQNETALTRSGRMLKIYQLFLRQFCVAGRKIQNVKTLHADLLLSGIAQLVTVMVADKIRKHEYLRSLRPLIA